jgi:hypothetical protein
LRERQPRRILSSWPSGGATHDAMVRIERAFDVPAILEPEYERVEERCRVHGWQRALTKLPAERAWLEANRGLF